MTMPKRNRFILTVDGQSTQEAARLAVLSAFASRKPDGLSFHVEPMKEPSGERRSHKHFAYDERDKWIRQLFERNPDPSIDEIKELAIEMQASGLYSPTTYLGDIERSIRRGMAALKKS